MRRLQGADCHRLCGTDAEAGAAAAAGLCRDLRRRRAAEPRVEVNCALRAGIPAGLAVDAARREAGPADGGQVPEGRPRPVAEHRLGADFGRSEEHTSEQSLMRISYAVSCLKKKKHTEYPQPNNEE